LFRHWQAATLTALNCNKLGTAGEIEILSPTKLHLQRAARHQTPRALRSQLLSDSSLVFTSALAMLALFVLLIAIAGLDVCLCLEFRKSIVPAGANKQRLDQFQNWFSHF
jgi:hypothetical protein